MRVCEVLALSHRLDIVNVTQIVFWITLDLLYNVLWNS